MIVKQAIKIAIIAMEEKRKKFAVDANLVRLTGTGSPYMYKALEEYNKINEAIEILQTLEKK